jgi:hypothetical protein
MPKFSEIGMMVDKFKRNNFPLWEVQIPNRIWIKNSESQIKLNLVLNLRGFKPSDKHSINSPKFFLDMIFNTVNLDGLTCIKNFEVPLEVANWI